MSPAAAAKWRITYDRWAPLLAFVIFLTALGAGVATYVNDQNDRERDRAITLANTQRLEDNARLLDCFDKFASSLAGGLPPVRQATVLRDDALGEALTTLREVLVKVAAANVQPKDVEQLIADLAAYQKANDHLAQVRTDNPYPEAPSTFCAS